MHFSLHDSFASLHHSLAASYFFFLMHWSFNCHPWQSNRLLLSLLTPHSSSHILNSLISSPLCSIVTPSFICPWSLSLFLISSLHKPHIFPSLCPVRCGPRRAGEALHPEATTVLRSFRLPVRPAERPEMEGSEAGGAERDGGVHHPQQECHHRAHLPGGGAHGQ